MREAKVEVKEIPGKPGCYNAVAWLRPWLQLEELTTSLRMVASIPTDGRLSRADGHPPGHEGRALRRSPPACGTIGDAAAAVPRCPRSRCSDGESLPDARVGRRIDAGRRPGF